MGSNNFPSRWIHTGAIVLLAAGIVALLVPTVTADIAIGRYLRHESGQIPESTIVFVSIGGLGHLSPVHTLAQEAVDRGHRVTLVTYCGPPPMVGSPVSLERGGQVICAPDSQGTGYQSLTELGEEAIVRFVDVAEHPNDMAAIHRLLDFLARAIVPLWKTLFTAFPNTKDFPIDLIVADYVSTPGVAFAVDRNIRLVLNAPSTLVPIYTNAIPPNVLDSRISASNSLFQKLYHYAISWIVYGGTASVIPDAETFKMARLPAADLTEEIRRSLDRHVVLFDTFLGVDYPQIIPSNWFVVGPITPRERDRSASASVKGVHGVGDGTAGTDTTGDGTTDPSSDSGFSVSDVQTWTGEHRAVTEFLDAHPVVLFVNFGTTGVLLSAQVDVLIAGWSQLNAGRPVAVLWRLHPRYHSMLPSPIPVWLMVRGWLPSQDAVLEHPHVKAFMSHAGFNSPLASIAAGVPLVLSPCFADQLGNSARLVDAGVATRLPQLHWTAADVEREIVTILDDHAAYRKRTLRLRDLMHEFGGRERAMDILEHVIRFGDSHLIPANAFESRFSQMGLDVFFAGHIILSFVWLIGFFVTRWMFRKIVGVFRRSQSPIKTKVE